MKRNIFTFFLVCGLFIILFIPVEKIGAEVADGIYEVDYEVIHAENESASIANDYFEKPAVLLVKDGQQYVRFQINHSDYVKQIQLPEGDDFVDAEKKEENEADETFDAILNTGEDIFVEPILLKMHIIVEDVDPPIDYNPAARFQFDEESLAPYEGDFTEADILPADMVEDEADAADNLTENDADSEENAAEVNVDESNDNEEPVSEAEKESNSALFIWLGIGALILIVAVIILRRKK